MSDGAPVTVLPFLSAGDGMVACVRSFPWHDTPLGPIERWPTELIAGASFVLESRLPAALLWGAEMILIPNSAFAALIGQHGADRLGDRFDSLAGDEWDAVAPVVRRALSGEATYSENWSIVLDRQGWPERAWFTVSTSPFRAADGAVAGVVLMLADATEVVQAKARAEVLAGELGHRLKNTMAMVHAMAQQSLRNLGERDAVEAFKDRIVALGRAHDVLLQKSWERASIGSVIEALTGIHGGTGQFRATGPEVMLGPKAVLSLSMLLHELATNASKYGALTVSGGHVLIEWRIDDGPAGETLVIEWRECGGPPAKPSAREGFGSRLINLGLLGTRQVSKEFASEGFAAAFRAPLRQLQGS